MPVDVSLRSSMSRRVLTLGWLGRVFLREDQSELEESALPDGLVAAWNAHLPSLEVDDAIRASDRFGEEAERVVLAPLLALFGETSSADSRHGGGEARVAFHAIPMVAEQEWRSASRRMPNGVESCLCEHQPGG